MSEKYSLSGKVVQLFLQGQWEFAGRVEHIDEERLVLKSDMGSLVVYRKNIIAAMIIEEKSSEDSIDEVSPQTYNDSMNASSPVVVKGGPHYNDTAEESYYGSVIPSDMLVGEDNELPVSFSLSMASLKNIRPAGEDKNGSKEKDGLDRSENKE